MRKISRPAVGFVALLALAGCGGGIGGNILGEGTPADPAEAQIARLTGQGFILIADGRKTGEPSALRYKGAPDPVVVCQPATTQIGSATASDGRYIVTQSAEVQAYVIVISDGGLRGLYVDDVTRSVATSDGTMVARQFEKVEFPPGGSGRFRNGVVCQPA